MRPFDFDNSYANKLEGLYTPWKPEGFPDPRLVMFNQTLAKELGLDADILKKHGSKIFSGNDVPAGAAPLAQAYAGHQFGHFSPRLGDGRALLLGEVLDAEGTRRDLQLKGSGKTPFSRGGDGRATLGPVLREYLMGEAMHRLGVPTTRMLAALTTGEDVRRTEILPGAVLCRVASSHLRVGTFQFFASEGDQEKLRRLTDYAIERHYPHQIDAENRAFELVREVAIAQATLIARWMCLGFIHGVMNTDNATISGETIDYGPCAFMDHYDPKTVFSSIDRNGRYAFGNQPGIGAWNVARLAEALLPLIDVDPKRAEQLAQSALDVYAETYQSEYIGGMAKKFGLRGGSASDQQLIEGFLNILARGKLDYTSSFRSLGALVLDDQSTSLELKDSSGFAEWRELWMGRLVAQGRLEEAKSSIDAANPIYVPRNHLVEEALSSAIVGELGLFESLLEVLAEPFEVREGFERYSQPAPTEFGERYQTFCGT